MASKKKKTVKKAPKKRASKAPKRAARDVSFEGGEHHSVLREALRDIAKELGQLREEKEELEATLSNVSGDIASTQNKEVSLKDQLHRLSSVEISLNLKKNRIKKRLDSVKGKIQKVKDLSSKMENI